jgi:uncharacterized membrane protein
VGRVTSLVVGRQAFKLFEAALDRLPVVAKIYSSVRQLLDSMMVKKDSTQRVVLVDFPIVGQKSIGFLTRTLTDETTGELLAAVLLPNACPMPSIQPRLSCRFCPSITSLRQT